ncbi:MAG: hypothetical protein H6577_00500 [Lewinellaceae bacterium]|nr:hypothetical protein [Lewinellaceae bacterium]
MTTDPLHILPTALLPAFCEAAPEAQLRSYEALQDSELSEEAFSFYSPRWSPVFQL